MPLQERQLEKQRQIMLDFLKKAGPVPKRLLEQAAAQDNDDDDAVDGEECLSEEWSSDSEDEILPDEENRNALGKRLIVPDGYFSEEELRGKDEKEEKMNAEEIRAQLTLIKNTVLCSRLR